MNVPIETIIQYGLPTVLLSILVLGLWKGSHKIAGWVQPIVERLTNEHLDLVNTLKTNSIETTKSLTSIKTHLGTQTIEIEKQSGILEAINRKTIECPYKVSQKNESVSP